MKREGDILEIIDLSQPIADNMPVYPGDSVTSLMQINYLKESRYNSFRLETCMHAGTHIDSPMHMTENARYISDLPLGDFFGNGCVIDARNQPVITLRKEYEKMIPEKSIVLIYTGFDSIYGTGKYYDEHPVVDKELCSLLIEKDIRMLGMDMPSPDKYPFEIHKALFKKQICIIENLTNLDRLLEIKSFDIIALPLRINADSSVARVAACIRR